jgi:hypothetical protein
MLDDTATGTGGSTPIPHCNWCSAPLPSDHEETCPSCGATLLGDGDTSVPGLTAIDAEAILRSARAAKAKPRSRLLGWISGEYDDESSGATPAPGSLAPPSADVRREMLRLELQAQVANAQAEVESMAADDALEHGRTLGPTGADASLPDEAAEAVADDESREPADATGSAPEAVADAPEAAADAPESVADTSGSADGAPPA